MDSLEKILARNLSCSRAEARRLLANQGPRFAATTATGAYPRHLTIAGRKIELHDSFHLMLHKPAGCVTALFDSRHETAAPYVRGAPLGRELRPVGRLDIDTTGLLVWTTDGDWLHRLTHPRTALPRTYHAALARPFQSPPANLVLRDGHQPRMEELRPLSANEAHPGLLRPDGATAFASITIADGAYHEVRRIFAALGSHVFALCRVSFGKLTLPQDLAAGSWRRIEKADVDSPAT